MRTIKHKPKKEYIVVIQKNFTKTWGGYSSNQDAEQARDEALEKLLKEGKKATKGKTLYNIHGICDCYTIDLEVQLKIHEDL